MDKRTNLVGARSLGLCATLIGLVVGCNQPPTGEESLALGASALEPVCIAPPEQPPEDSWVCGVGHIVECQGPEGAEVGEIFAPLPSGERCADVTLMAAEAGPFGLGPHAVAVDRIVEGPDGPERETLCSSILTVVDTTPPTITPHAIELPADGAFHTVTPLDCADIDDACEPELTTAEFTFVRSDVGEEGDADLGCGEASLFGARDAAGAGRTYTLGVRATDAWGNSTETICRVVVSPDEGAPLDEAAEAPLGDGFELSTASCDAV